MTHNSMGWSTKYQQIMQGLGTSSQVINLRQFPCAAKQKKVDWEIFPTVGVKFSGKKKAKLSRNI